MDDAVPLLLTPPPLDWDEHGVPSSIAFGDVYFSRDGGMAETDYVFLQNNRLCERWLALDPTAAGTFVIGETGFGTGLNFLCAARLWLATAPPSWRLHFVSTERYPLSRDDFARAASHWPELAELASALGDIWPPAVHGFHSRDLANGRVRLQLLLGDASALLPQLEDSAVVELPSGFAVDAWFLDGFAPARNPTLWSEQLLASVARLSRPGTTVATFTAAGSVRRALVAAGFAVTRVRGYGTKREMLRGDFRGGSPAPAPVADRVTAADYWAWPPPARRRQPIVVVGGGLAGTSTAQALARRGYPVTLLEAGPTLAPAASGNPLGVLYTKLSAHNGMVAGFALASWLHALAWYRQGFAEGRLPPTAGQLCGMLQLVDDPALLAQLTTVFAGAEWVRPVDATVATELAGCPVSQPGLWFPDAGWLAPALLCEAQARHPLIDVQLDTQVDAIERCGLGWRLHTPGEAIETGIVVVAAAQQAARLVPAVTLPLRSIRGQITRLPAAWLTAVPRAVICHDGYTAALPDGSLCIGATFDLRDDDTDVRLDSHAQNLAALEAALPQMLRPGLAQAPPLEQLAGRVSFRCASPDYLPLAGPLPEPAPTRMRFGGQRGRRLTAAEPAWQHGLYLNVGHGSRGLTSTPLCAELLAALIAGEPRPLPRAIVQALSPARFLVRQLIREGR